MLVFPLPSRIEATRPTLHKEWRYGNPQKEIVGYQPHFEDLLKEVYNLRRSKLGSYFDEVQIQQIPDYAYGEEIAVLIENGGDRLSLTRSYESFTEQLIRPDGPWVERDSTLANFDVFLSYNSQDKLIVKAIAEQLKQRGLRPWFDEDQLKPGDNWARTVREALQKIKTVAILVGSQGMPSWQQEEVSYFIQKQPETELHIIPIILPGADTSKLPKYLQMIRWLDLSEGIDDIEAMNQLEWGITGKRPS